MLKGVTAAFFLLFFSAKIAAACPMLESAEPKVGGTATSGLQLVRILFSSGITPSGSSILVSDSAGNRMSVGDAYGDASNTALATEVTPLQPGKYKVVWTVQCPHCEKPQTGSYKFTVAK